MRIMEFSAQMGRLFLAAVVCAVMLMAGRWAGFANYHVWVDQNRSALDATTPGVEQVGASFVANNLVTFRQVTGRFGWGEVPDAQEWVFLGLYLSVLGGLSLLLVRYSSLRCAPLLLHTAPSPGRETLRKTWSRTVARSAILVPIGGIALIVGFASFVGDSFYTRLVILSEYSSGLFSRLFSFGPQWGMLSYIEAATLSASALVIPGAVSLFVARRALRHGHNCDSRLCWKCGYPRPDEHSSHSGGDTVCSECGARAAPTALRLRARWVTLLGVVLMTTLAMSSLYALDRNSAVFAYHISGIKPAHYDPEQATQDVVMMEAGVVYRVKMPGEQFWIRFNSATEIGDDIASGTLSFVVESPSKGSQRTGTERFEFVCHRDNLLPEPAPGNLPMPAPGAVQRWQGTLTTPAGNLIEWKLAMRKGLRWANDTGGLYLSPRRATSIKAVASGDHPPFSEP